MRLTIIVLILTILLSLLHLASKDALTQPIMLVILDFIVVTLVMVFTRTITIAVTLTPYLLEALRIANSMPSSISILSPSLESNFQILLAIIIVPLLVFSLLIILYILSRKSSLKDSRLYRNLKTYYEELLGNIYSERDSNYLLLYSTVALIYSLILYTFSYKYDKSISAILQFFFIANTSLGAIFLALALRNTLNVKEAILNVSILLSLPLGLAPLFTKIEEDYPEIRRFLVKCEKKPLIGVIEAAVDITPLSIHSIERLNSNSYEGKWRLAATPKIGYCIDLTETNTPHIAITGSTGSGKTSLAAQIAKSIITNSKGRKIIIIDPHGEYRTRLGNCCKLEEILVSDRMLLTPINETPIERANEVIELVKQFFNIGQVQEYLLYEALIGAYEEKGYNLYRKYMLGEETPIIDIADVIEALRKLSKTLYHMNASAVTLIRYLERLSGGLKEYNISYHRGEDLAKMLSKQEEEIIIANMASLRTNYQKIIAAEILLRILYYISPTLKGKTPLTILVDEAHLFLPKSRREPVLLKIVRELRKYNISVIVVTQNITDLHEEVLNNVGFFFSLRVVEESNLTKTARILSGYMERERLTAIEKILSSLPVGYTLARDVRLSEPILIRVRQKREK